MKKTKENKQFRILLIDDNRSIHDDFMKVLTAGDTDSLDELEQIVINNKAQETTKENTPPPLEDIQNMILNPVSSSEEGIELIKKSITEDKPYAVAILDIRIPGGLDGVETAKKIFEIDKNVQIIFCTAYSDYEWNEMLAIVQNSDRWILLKKPFSLIEARQMILTLAQKWLLLLNMKNEIKHLAYYDALTELPNRHLFKELLERSLCDGSRTNTKVALLFIGIDDFKKINDIYGHTIGDMLLKDIAKRLSLITQNPGFTNKYDQNQNIPLLSLSRLGGDELTIIAKNFTDKNILLKLANHILSSISCDDYLPNNESIKITASIGISFYPTEANTADKLLKNADVAMYRAKQAGKNRIALHNNKLNKEILSRNLIERDLYSALKNNEFQLYYQPQISIKQKRITGVEALIRWEHPTRGLIMPGAFLPIAEESDAIVEIDQYVLKKACEQIAQWKKLGIYNNLVTAINISAKFFDTENIATAMESLIRKNKLSASNLGIEITESQLIQSRKKIINNLNELQQHIGSGLRVSIDDFGVGYSSLAYLSEFPVDELKIDRSFISKIDLTTNHNKIVNAIIALTHSLKRDVLAEGVETWNQYEYLENSKCDKIQGFLIAKPMPANMFVEFLNNWDAEKQTKAN
ncbi:MAG: EAL domain-containing protein [Coxiellaceae bacterium]|nr:EAL domain-containing protein [Coxiellaceae bacterium]